jgi:dipeptide/tripeptide permease
MAPWPVRFGMRSQKLIFYLKFRNINRLMMMMTTAILNITYSKIFTISKVSSENKTKSLLFFSLFFHSPILFSCTYSFDVHLRWFCNGNFSLF